MTPRLGQNPSADEQRNLREIVEQSVGTTRADIVRDLQERRINGASEFERDRAADVIDLVNGISELDYKQFRQFLGNIDTLREVMFSVAKQPLTTRIERYEDALSEMCDQAKGLVPFSKLAKSIQEMYDNDFKGIGKHALEGPRFSSPDAVKEGMAKFAEQIMLLTRATRAEGINITNPDWNPRSKPTSLDSEKRHILELTDADGRSLRSGHVEIRPNRDAPGVRVKYVPPGSHWDLIRTERAVGPGESISVGRPNVTLGGSDDLLGVRIPEHKVRPDLPTADEHVYFSRTAVRVTVPSGDGGTVIPTDHGLRFSLTRKLGDGLGETYVPRTVSFGDDELSFGGTVFTQHFDD